MDMPVDMGQTRSKSLDSVALVIATWFGVGFLPWAPGTWASISAIFIFVLFSCLGWTVHLLIGVAVCLVIFLLPLGIWAAGRVERILGNKDDGRIVIDEVFGQCFSLVPLVAKFTFFSSSPFVWETDTMAAAVTAFVAFRCFDITKLGPVGWAERKFSGGLGVILDDLVAGFMAAVFVAVVIFVISPEGEIY